MIGVCGALISDCWQHMLFIQSTKEGMEINLRLSVNFIMHTLALLELDLIKCKLTPRNVAAAEDNKPRSFLYQKGEMLYFSPLLFFIIFRFYILINYLLRDRVISISSYFIDHCPIIYHSHWFICFGFQAILSCSLFS